MATKKAGQERSGGGSGPILDTAAPAEPPISRPMEMTPEDMAVLLDQGVGSRLATLTKMVEGAVNSFKAGKKDLDDLLKVIARDANSGSADAHVAKEEAELGFVMTFLGLILLLVVIFWQGCSTKSIYHAVFDDKDKNRIEAIQGQLNDVTKKLEDFDAKSEPIMGFVQAEKAKRDEAERLQREAEQAKFEEHREQVKSEVTACIDGAKTAEEVAACTSTDQQQVVPSADPSAAEKKPDPVPPEPVKKSHGVTKTLPEDQEEALKKSHG